MSEPMKSLKTLLANYLADLDRVHSRMLDYFNQSQIELVRPNVLEQPGTESEGMSAPEELRTMVARRDEILKVAQSQGLGVTTLAELASRLEGSEGSLARSVSLMKRKMEAMRYASLSHWVSCQKSWLHYSQLVQFIANGGRKPLMGENSRCGAQGGVILDAKV